MTLLDYGRSFVTFETRDRANNARIQVEARCRLWRSGDPAPLDFCLVASCKAERTHAFEALFQLPNYDFCGIFSERDYQIIRTHATADRGGRETGRVAERFHEVRFSLAPAQGGRECASADEIVAATLANRPLVGRTEIVGDGGSSRAMLEYPVKTMNANAARGIWQVDTGPLILPDWPRAAADPISGFDLAFVAYNTLDRAEFILRRPQVCGVGSGAAEVEHYGAVRMLPARNSLYVIG